MTPNYLSDEELMQLISDIEASPVQTAPPYLKDEILKQAAKTKAIHAVTAAIPKKQELFRFSARVIAAAAAAIALLIVMPGVSQMEQMQMEQNQIRNQITDEAAPLSHEEKDSLLRTINDKTSQLFSFVSLKTDAILFQEDN